MLRRLMTAIFILALFAFYACMEPSQRLPEPAVKYPFIFIPYTK